MVAAAAAAANAAAGQTDGPCGESHVQRRAQRTVDEVEEEERRSAADNPAQACAQAQNMCALCASEIREVDARELAEKSGFAVDRGSTRQMENEVARKR